MPRFSSKVEKAEANGSADYLKPLHPGTYCLPKRACLKPFTQESLFLDDHKLSLIERSSKAKKSFEKAFSHSCHNKVMSLPWYPSLTSASPIKGSNNGHREVSKRLSRSIVSRSANMSVSLAAIRQSHRGCQSQ